MHSFGWIATLIIASGIGSYIGSYLKKKGENLATHDDLDKLVAQMQATTEATKAIETRIDDQIWNKQRQWEMKRDVLLGLARTISDFEQAVMDIGAKIERHGNSVYEAERFNRALAAWNATSAKFEQDSFVAGLVISMETRLALMELKSALRGATNDVLKTQTHDAYKAHHKNVVFELEKIKVIIRKELGVAELTPQSSKS